MKRSASLPSDKKNVVAAAARLRWPYASLQISSERQRQRSLAAAAT